MEVKFVEPEQKLTCTLTGTREEFKTLYNIMLLDITVPSALPLCPNVKAFMQSLKEQLRRVVYR